MRDTILVMEEDQASPSMSMPLLPIIIQIWLIRIDLRTVTELITLHQISSKRSSENINTPFWCLSSHSFHRIGLIGQAKWSRQLLRLNAFRFT